MNKIVKIEKSWKYGEGFCMVAVEGKDQMLKRKISVRKTGELAGKVLVNVLNSNTYSFTWNGNIAENIKWEGNYRAYTGIYSHMAEKVPGTKIVVDELKAEVKAKSDVVVELPKSDVKGVKHSKYEQIKTCVNADIPVYLYGPAGSGKNHTLQQIATDLGLEFYFTNSVQQEYKITGFIDAGGKFHETEFYKAFVNGGLFFLDEMDASIPEVLVLLNAALANRYFEFPNGKVNAHPDFRVVAAGNTVGNGADESYTGRLQLDQATLDRFVLIEFDYDLNIEKALAKGNMELVNFIRGLRKQAKEKGIRATFSYRCIISVIKLEGKLELKDIILINTFTAGMGKYNEALRMVQKGA